MKRSFLILLSLLFMISMVSGCSQSGSNYEYDTPQIKSISSGRTGVSITIEAVEGVKSYRILRKNEDQKWAVYAHSKSSNYIDENVESAGTYSYTVLCESEDGKTPLSGYDKKGKTVTFISTPSLTDITNEYTGIKVNWNASQGASRYRVFRKTNDSNWEILADVSTTYYIDSTAVSGTEYTYTSQCIDEKGNYISDCETGKTITYISPPKIKRLTYINKGVKITWKDSQGASRYRVFRKTKDSSTWEILADTDLANYTDSTIVSGAEYFYTVRCIDSNGNYISNCEPGKQIKCY